MLSVGGQHFVPQVGADAGDEAGDVHLGEAEFLADLGLCHLGAEAQFEEGAASGVELGQVRLEGLDVFGQGEGGIFGADDVGDQAGLLLGAGSLYGRVDGVTVVAVCGDETLRNLCLVDVEVGGEVGGPGCRGRRAW